MFLFIGLGNPGPRYALTRHNVGFLFVDELRRKGVRKSFNKRLYEAHLLEGEGKTYIAKPLTFMNLSGIAVRMMVKDFNFTSQDTIVVVYDDIWIPLGRIRIRENGSDGGHNGLKSVINELGSNNFPRIRIGVGPLPEDCDMIDFVLGRFSNEEYSVALKSIQLALEAAQDMVAGDLKKTMSKYNGIQVE